MKTRAAAFFAVLLLGGCFVFNRSIEVADGTDVDRSLETVNGSIHVGSDSRVNGDVGTVNGSIEIGDNTVVTGEVTTVNGKISLGAGASARSVEGVNGPLGIGSDAQVEGNAATVNGQVVLARGAIVGGEVASVKGQIRLEGATAGSIRAVGGGIVLEEGSRLLGELRVEKPRRGANDPVTVIIHANCEVVGPLVFERSINLRIHESATVGEIQGAEPEYFSD